MKRIWLLAVVLLAGCNKTPYERTTNDQGGAMGGFSGTAALTVFSNELFSGGGAFLYPGGENQTLTFGDLSNPIGKRSIRYVWNGQPVRNIGCAPDPTFGFAGFDLMHTPTQDKYATTPGRDLRAAGYTQVKFYARGTLSTNVYLKVEVASPGSTNPCIGVLSPCLKLIHGTDPDPSRDSTCTVRPFDSHWQSYSIAVANGDLVAVKDLFKATFVFVDPFIGNQTPGQGGTVYFDQIFYQP